MKDDSTTTAPAEAPLGAKARDYLLFGFLGVDARDLPSMAPADRERIATWSGPDGNANSKPKVIWPSPENVESSAPVKARRDTTMSYVLDAPPPVERYF